MAFSTQVPARRFAESIAIRSVGVVLLMAALLKLHAMVLHGSAVTEAALVSVLVAVEIALGGLLVFAPPSRRVVVVAGMNGTVIGVNSM